MKIRLALFGAAAIWLGSPAFAAAQSAPAPPHLLIATIDTTRTSPPVSKYEFGMFIEHIGPLIYRSLWSEMLDDRKFYFPITAEEKQSAPARTGGMRGQQLRKWRPVGPAEFVSMDKEHAFVGDQSPRIELDPSTPHGIRQSGLAVVRGKHYTGRIYLRGVPGSRVKVALIWGTGPDDRQTISIPALTAEYRKFPLSFTAKADSEQAALEITGTGKGSFHIGTVSLMPSDNIQGFRPDTIALLRQLHSGMWRLPGGNFLSDWNWYDAVGDIDKRPPMFDYAWNAMQSNDVGMDEFMTLCKLIGVDPYITVNAGFGDSRSAADEVQYINGSAKTPMGAWRAKNGHLAPYHVKYWDIGNEPWGSWQLGRTDLKYFVLKHNEFAKAMRKADPSITLLASGEMLEPTALTGEMRAKYVDNIQPLFGSEEDWTGGFLAHSWGNFDGITEHWYAQGTRYFDVDRAKHLPLDAPSDRAYVKIDPTPLEYARGAANNVRRIAEEWQGYQQRFPKMLDKKIFLSVDEYAYFGGGFGAGVDLKQALAYGMLFNEMLRHTDFLTMSAHTMGVSTMDINPTAAVFNPLGLVFKMYGDRFVGSIPVAVSGNSPQPPLAHSGGDQPKETSGSPTYPLDVFAALTADRKFLTVAVVNATNAEQNLDLRVTGARLEGPSTLWLLTGKSLDALNRIGQPPQVVVQESTVPVSSQSITIAPISVDLYRIPVTATQSPQ